MTALHQPAKIPFLKPPTTYIEQIALLRKRGMLVADDARAEFYLRHISYYRLCAYWLIYESDHPTHTFKAGTNFDDVIKLYNFDRELRLLVMDAIERIEISLRTQWAYHMAHDHGAHAHLKQALARDRTLWQENIDDLKKSVARSEEVFIKHMVNTYSENLPAIWAACEVMPLGLLARWFNNLSADTTRDKIGSTFQIEADVLGSWMHHLSIVRNRCAHHSRLWNHQFRLSPKKTKNKPTRLLGQYFTSNRIYNTLVIMLYLMDCISPAHTWRSKLKSLLVTMPLMLSEMGFPPAWSSRDIWQNPPH